MDAYEKQVQQVVSAVKVLGPYAYKWLGLRRRRLVTPATTPLVPDDLNRTWIVSNLQLDIYVNFYQTGVVRETFTVGNDVGPARTPFTENLSAANLGMGNWEGSWKVVELLNDAVVASRQNLRILLDPQDFRPNDTASIGSTIEIHRSKERFNISPGFYMALSDTEMVLEDSQDILRMYWNITATGARWLVSLLTNVFNSEGLPFKFKTLSEPRHYNRCDAAVLYTLKCDYNAVHDLIKRIYPQVSEYLKPDTPALTKRLAPGLGLAECPPGGESYGFDRSGLISQGIVSAYERRLTSALEQLDSVRRTFAENDLSLTRPYLNPGSVDDYIPLWPHGVGQSRPLLISSEGPPEPATVSYLEAAARIGYRLSREAVWYSGRCNWVGAASTPRRGAVNSVTSEYRSLGPDMYGGSSGIAWFMADLHIETGDVSARRTSIGAMAQAVSQAAHLPLGRRLGLYDGALGVAVAAVRIGILLRSTDLLDRGLALARVSATTVDPPLDFDLLSGCAGAVIALVRLFRQTNESFYLERAVRLGDELVNTAKVSRYGCSWPSLTMRNRHNLTGLSHGAAGAGLALLELFSETAAAEYRQTAESAFGYERYWFQSAVSNWPDFRDLANIPQSIGSISQCATFWCHGAPGIALSRMRAFQLFGGASYREEVRVALRTTCEWLCDELDNGSGTFSLCHGLCGNVDVLLQCMELSDEADSLLQTVRRVARHALSVYPPDARYRFVSDEPLGLMDGLAGVGHFYLRMANTSILSVLSMHGVTLAPAGESA